MKKVINYSWLRLQITSFLNWKIMFLQSALKKNSFWISKTCTSNLPHLVSVRYIDLDLDLSSLESEEHQIGPTFSSSVMTWSWLRQYGAKAFFMSSASTTNQTPTRIPFTIITQNLNIKVLYILRPGLLDCILFDVLLENISLIWVWQHCRRLQKFGFI
jgi:hypothetical protein